MGKRKTHCVNKATIVDARTTKTPRTPRAAMAGSNVIGSSKPAPSVANDPDLREHEEDFRKLTHFAKLHGFPMGSVISSRANNTIRFLLNPSIVRGKKQKADTTSGGKVRAAQQKALAETKASPIYSTYKKVLADGIPVRKAIGETTRRLQLTPKYNRITERQVRRAAERMKKEDSS